jgi:tetratricopeptide (TPR) repeat protein
MSARVAAHSSDTIILRPSEGLIVVTSLVLLAALVGQTPSNSPQPTPEAIAQAVRDLGADDYYVREKATGWLWSAGTAAEAPLRAVVTSNDPEVAARARDLLDKIPYGITPDMPRRFVELIGRARGGGSATWPGVVIDLLDLGPRGLEVARRLAERLGAMPGQRTYMLQVLDQEGWRVAPHFLVAGRAAEAEELLERSAVAGSMVTGEPTAVRHYAAVMKLQNRLGEQIPRWRELAEKNHGKDGPGHRLADGQPGGTAAAVILTYLARLQGDLEQARWAAERTGKAELKEAVLFDAGAWADLAALPPTATGNSPILRVGLQEMYLRAAGKTAEADKAVAELKTQPSTSSGTAPPLLFRALMFAQRPDDALAVLTEPGRPDLVVPRFEILAQRHDYAKAFEAMEQPLPDHSTYRWQRDTARIRVYHQLGNEEKLREVLRGVQQYDRINQNERAPVLDLVEQLVSLHLQEEALPIAVALLNGGAPPADVFAKVAPKTPLAAEAWWRYLRLQPPVEPIRNALARLPALLDKRLNSDEGKALVAAAAAVARTQPPPDADRWLQGLGEACHAAGLVAEARGLYEEAARRFDSPAAWQKLGEFRADQKQFAEAAAAFESAWRKDVIQALPLWLAGWAKTNAGDATGRAMMDLAHILPLGDEDARATFAEELVKRAMFAPEAADAARQERRLVLQLGLPTSSRGRNVQGPLSADPLAYPDRLAAADAAQRFLFRMLQTNAYFKRNEGYLAVLHRLHDHRARGLLAKGDVAGAVREAETAHALLPSHAALAVAIVPSLQSHGHPGEAADFYAKVAGVLDGLCEDYPKSAHFANERAWLAARCRRDLDRARELAEHAVTLSPKTAAYQETLAEVLFQKGEREAAVARLGQALELDPKNEYYLKQKARFTAGNPDAPVPDVGR